MIFTLEFGDYTFPNQTFESEDIISSNSIKEENIVRQHGAVIQTPFLSAKRFKIKGIIHNTTQALSSSELDDLQQNLLADKNFLEIEQIEKLKLLLRK